METCSEVAASFISKRATGGPAWSQFTGYRLAEEANIEVTGRRPWSRHQVEAFIIGERTVHQHDNVPRPS